MNKPASRTDPRIIAALVSLVVGTVLLAAKFTAWRITASTVVFSDAMESIINVVAAGAALLAVWLSSQPADENHPYGHGKIEFVTAAFEGGLIVFASIAILYGSIEALIIGNEPRQLSIGIWVVGAAGVANLLLGLYLVRTGKQHHSPALVADGKHVISDFYTSLGAVIGLVAVQLSGIAALDAIGAMLVALLLLRSGAHVVREAARGLMDEYDPDAVEVLAHAMEAARETGIIEVHDLRAIDVGGFRHVDCHVVVPEFWTVDQAHEVVDRYEQRVVERAPHGAELQFHTDPCERAYCKACDLVDCPVRKEPFQARAPLSADHVIRGPSPPGENDVHS